MNCHILLELHFFGPRVLLLLKFSFCTELRGRISIKCFNGGVVDEIYARFDSFLSRIVQVRFFGTPLYEANILLPVGGALWRSCDNLV
mmetsp:Transcript_60344/g.160633  ORF Transcript_60344/g.160633 Transcript_60344/m.160633 type:complete len:88 (-) Transcript_60344:871-1134(-)